MKSSGTGPQLTTLWKRADARHPPVCSGPRGLSARLGAEFTAVLSRLDGVDIVAARLMDEIRNYQPTLGGQLADVCRIFLLSQIDAVWWSGTAPFVSDTDVPAFDRTGGSHAAQVGEDAGGSSTALSRAGLPGRARDWAQRQALPTMRPRTRICFTRSRPTVVAVVNQIAGELAPVPPESPRLWVTSMVRSVQHQHRLRRSLGYAAVLPSSHCAGYACDVEMQWFRRFDQDNLLARLLLERQEAGRA